MKKFIILFLIIICMSLFNCKSNGQSSFKYSIDISNFNSEELYLETIRTQLLEEGYLENKFLCKGSKIFTDSLEIIINIKRIIAFDDLYAGITSHPIIDLTIFDNNGVKFDIITSRPFIVDMKIIWNEREFLIENIEKYWEYKVEELPSMILLNRDEIIEKYFEANLFIKKQIKPVDYNFYYSLIKKGFYVYFDCLTGKLRVK